MPRQTEYRPIEVDPERDLLTPKELAFSLRVSVRYVYAMRRSGFAMPAGTATLAEARRWIVEKDFKASGRG